MHITHIISSLKLGGAETCLHSLITYLKGQNYRQTVLYFHDGPVRQQIESLGILCYQVTGAVHQYDPVFLFRLYRAIQRLKPDVIHSSLWAANFFGVFCARLLKIPIVSALHTVQEHEGKLRNFLTQFSLPCANTIIAVAQAVANSAQKKYNLTTSRLAVVPNGIDTQILHDRAQATHVTREQLGISPDAFIIGSVGRFVKVKNYAYLLEVCAALINKQKTSIPLALALRLRSGVNGLSLARRSPKGEDGSKWASGANDNKIPGTFHVMLVGLGPEEDNLRNRARELGIAQHVTFIIGQPAYKYYQLFNCFVQPSLFEGLSIALLEAVSLSIPVIVASETKQHDLLEHEVTGIVCQHAQLAQAVEQLYASPDLCLRLAQSGAKLVGEKYSLDSMGRQYTHIFNKCISN